MTTLIAALGAAFLFALAAWLKPTTSCSEHCSSCPADCVLKTGEFND